MSFLFTTLIFLSGLVPKDTSDILKWDNNYLLKYCDFKMTPPLKSHLNAVGLCRLKIDYEINENFYEFKVIAVFNRDSSWIKEKFTSINHIQYQFNLFEVYARILRKELQLLGDKKNQPMEVKITSKIKEIQRMLYEESRKFELESLNGDNLEYEKKWENRINIKLEELKNYSFSGSKFVDF